MEILHFKDLGDAKVSSTNAVWMLIESLAISVCSFTCLKFESNWAITYGYIAI